MKKNTFKILIADDDSDDLDFLKFLFSKHNAFELVGCLKSGQAILDYFSKEKNSEIPDILLTDMYMPLLTGAEVVERLEQTDSPENMQIFIISTTINQNEQDRFLNNENVKFIQKPVTLAEINDLPEVILESLNAAHVNRI